MLNKLHITKTKLASCKCNCTQLSTLTTYVTKISVSFLYTLQWRNNNLQVKARFTRRLQEAIEAVLQDSEDNKFDLAIIPPDPSALTDEKEGADDDIMAYSIPQDVHDTIEVLRNREDNGSRDSTHSDCDDEPIVS